MSTIRHHNEWLSLVPNTGPFVSLPVLTQVFPQGLDAHDAEHARRLRLAFEEWDENQSGLRPDPAIHRAWINLVLVETLGYEDLLAEGQAIPQTLKSDVAECGEILRPDLVLNDPATKKARLLVQVFPRSQPLGKPVQKSRWKASPDTRMMQLLHDTGVRLGLVTNGDEWMLVNAPKNETTGYASWFANLWLEEPLTLRAFRTLLSAERFFGVPDDQAIEALLDRSASDQQEVTDQLGYQVRKAVEVLIQSLDKADQDHGRTLLADVPEAVLYEAALTVMMRLVFLFCAEERELLLLGDEIWDRNYAVSTLREQLRTTADQFGEEILGLRHDAWARLLTTFRAVYAGVHHDRFKLPAYGGNLFNPDRFQFLEGRRPGTSWRDAEATPLPVSNRTVLHLLEALQVLQVRLPGGPAEARKLSFRSLDIEQIGHVYEGLLDHTARRAAEPVLGLQGTREKEPEVTLAELERLAAKGEKDLLAFLKEETGRSESALKKGLKAELDDQLVGRFRTACQDAALWKRVEPFAGLVRLDTVGYPVVITTGSVFVTAGADRRSSGTHYTPRSLTEPIVKYTLEPLVYVGPAEGLPKEEWKLRLAGEILDLKVCDMACGSGAFLVQACRYLAERLLEAWDDAQKAHPDVPGITPEGAPSTGNAQESLIPEDPSERQTYAMRLIAQRCLYGVDKNPLAAEMAKLSLWLLTLAKDKPFEFLDHAIRCGDSLVGMRDLEQLRYYSLKPEADDAVWFKGPIEHAVDEVVDLRLKLEGMPSNTVEEVEAQERLLAEADEKSARLRCAADLLVACEFWAENIKDKQEKVRHAAVVSGHYVDKGLTEEFRQVAAKECRGQLIFHWPLEFPEVVVKRGGFDAFIGNPPFLGAMRIAPAYGDHYQRYLKRVWDHRKGAADITAYFFLRAFESLKHTGNLGLIATNTLTQGNTLSVGLARICELSGTPYMAHKSRRWPGTANVFISVAHIHKGQWHGQFILDDELVQVISPSLDAIAFDGEPFPLDCTPCYASRGTTILGIGFVVSQDEADTMRSTNHNNAQVLFPYLNAMDFSSSPTSAATREVINFFEWSLEQAMQYVEPFRIVHEKVRPQRAKPQRQVHEDCYWKFSDKRPELYRSIASLDDVLVAGIATKYFAFTFVPTRQVFGDTVNVFATSDRGIFAVLSSGVHEAWASQFMYTLKGDPRYSLTTCFQTFAFVHPGQQGVELGTVYLDRRRLMMEARQEGLTKIYNRFHDFEESASDIQQLRELHVKMDRAITDAYGWSDLDLGHGFHETKQGLRFTISEPARREVLARLLRLNHERHAEEVAEGFQGRKQPNSRKGKKKPIAPKGNLSLFDEPLDRVNER